jgi:hypothetical protein
MESDYFHPQDKSLQIETIFRCSPSGVWVFFAQQFESEDDK